MKILMINVVCGILSTGRICTDLATALEKKGHTVKIAYGRGHVPDEFQRFAVRIGTNKDIWLHGVKARMFDACGFGSEIATKQFLKWVEDYNPDLIHLHNLHGYYINIKLLFEYLEKRRKRVIWTLHDCWAFTGHCSHFSIIGCDKWITGCGQCELKCDYPKTWFEHSERNYKAKKELFTSLRKEYLKIITPSKWLHDLVENSFLNLYDIEVIQNGIDLKIFNYVTSDLREKYNLENKKVILGVANIWTESKGKWVFEQLSQELSEEYSIVLIGAEEKNGSLRKENILHIGRTNDMQELVKWYSLADVYVNTSMQETMGLTTIEALACGTPVVVFNKTAIPEVVDDTCGIILKNSEIEEIKEAIYKCLDSRYSFENCRAQAEKFEKNKQYQKYIQVIDQMFV